MRGMEKLFEAWARWMTAMGWQVAVLGLGLIFPAVSSWSLATEGKGVSVEIRPGLLDQQMVSKITGVVRDEGGKPIGGAKVITSRRVRGKRKYVRAVTDTKGEFRIEGLRKGSWSLWALKEGYARPWSTHVCLPAIEPPRLGLVLYRPRSLRIRVLSPERKPMARVRVVVAREITPEGEAVQGKLENDLYEATTNRNGVAEFRNLNPGFVVLYIEHPGFAPFANSDLDRIPTGGPPAEIVLERGGVISGTVLREGKPFPNVPVLCSSDQAAGRPMGKKALVTTDKNGRFEIPDRYWGTDEDGWSHSVRTKSKDWFSDFYRCRLSRRHRSQSVVIEATRKGPRQLPELIVVNTVPRLPPEAWRGNAAIRGVVRDENGKPLPRVCVRLSPEPYREPFYKPEAATDEQGLFQFPKLKPGKYVLWSSPNYFAAEQRIFRPVRVTVHERETREVELRPGQGNILGRLQGIPKGIERVEADLLSGDIGRPWHKNILACRPDFDLATGAFAFPFVPRGHYDLLFVMKARRAADIVVWRGASITCDGVSTTNVICEVPRGAISGEIRSAVTGKPVQGAGIRLVYLTGNFPGDESDERGRFSFGYLPAGRYELRVHHTDYLPARREIVLPDEKRIELPPIDLGVEFGALAVVWDDGRSSRQAFRRADGERNFAWAFCLLPEERAAADTGLPPVFQDYARLQENAVGFKQLPPGLVHLAALRRRGTGPDEPCWIKVVPGVRIQNGRTTVVTVRPEPGAEVSLGVEQENGEWITFDNTEDLDCALETPQGVGLPGRHFLSNHARGLFRLEAGRYRFEARAAGYVSASKEFEVKAGAKPMRVILVMKRQAP